MTDSTTQDSPAAFCGSEVFVFAANVSPEAIRTLYRHVHHADSLKFLEQARLAFMAHAGFPNQQFLDRDLFLVLSRVEVSYLREVLSGPIEVTVESPRCLEDGRTIVLDQHLFRLVGGRRKLAVEATIYSVFMSGLTKRAVSPPADFLQALGVASRP